MPRRGRDLEQLAAVLERHLAGTGAKITSPDFIPDKASGQLREVDVSIRSEVGSAPVLVILECRDRARAQGAPWIEQLSGKRDSVGADVAVAVSSSGFTGPAQRKAEALGIQTRRLDEVTAEAVRSWCQVEYLELNLRRSDIIHVSIGIDPDTTSAITDEAKAILQQRDVNAPVFVISKDGRRCSLSGVWLFLSSRHDLYVDVQPDGRKLRRTLSMNFPNPQERYQIPGHPRPIDVMNMTMIVDLWIETTEIPAERRAAYATVEGQTHAQAVEFTFSVDDKKRTLSFVNVPSSGTSVFIRGPESQTE